MSAQRKTYRVEEDEIRRWIVDEVAKQISPMNALLQSINRWKLSLWSNGSGGPPGYLENARKEDEERYARLFESMNDLIDHKEVVNKFITILEQKEIQREKTRKLIMGLVWKVLGPLGVALLSACGWLIHQSLPVIRTIWDDYLKEHPALLQQISSHRPDPSFADDAAIPKVR